MTGRQHIAWYAGARGLRDLSLADPLAEQFDAVLDRPARELSKGNKHKVGLILAFMSRPARCGYRTLPARTGASEQPWSNHRCALV